MQEITLYRRRFIPDECIKLDSDYILEKNNDYMLTGWKCIKPRKDRAFGSSLFLFQEGIKISKFYNHEHKLICWYCDIMTFQEDPAENAVYTIDLLADVIIYPDNTYKVVDLDELAEAKEKGLISDEYLLKALTSLNFLLQKIYSNEFMTLQAPLDHVQDPWDLFESSKM